MKPLSWALAEPRDTEYRPLSVVFQVLFRMAICIKTVLVANLYIWSNTPTLLMRRHKCLFEEKRLDWKKLLAQESLVPYTDVFQPMGVSHLVLRLAWTWVLISGSKVARNNAISAYFLDYELILSFWTVPNPKSDMTAESNPFESCLSKTFFDLKSRWAIAGLFIRCGS